MLKGLAEKAERRAKAIKNTAALAASSPRGESKSTGTPGLEARIVWLNESQALMRMMMRSMTPPIHVNEENATDFVQDCITRKVETRLTEHDVWKGELVQLYCLSYKHESKEKPKRISRVRLEKVVESIRSHVTELGNRYYSIWIDSLFDERHADPNLEWADRGLAPYALCYVAASPGPQGFKADVERAWIRCEHQLAANGRGLLLHKDDSPPEWAVHHEVKSRGRSHLKLQGGSLNPCAGLHALALSICSGVLNGAQVTFTADLTRLLEWSRRVMCTKPSRLWSVAWVQNVPLPTKYVEPEGDEKVSHFIENTCFLVAVGAQANAIKPGKFVTRSGIHRMTWHTGFEYSNALCGHLGFKESDGFNHALWEVVGRKCRVYLVRCNNGSRRGLVVYGQSADGPSLRRDGRLFFRGVLPVGMDVDLEMQSDGTVTVRGYRIMHSPEIANALISLHGKRFDEDKEVSLEVSGEVLNVLSVLYYHKMGLTAVGLSMAYPESWKFRCI